MIVTWGLSRQTTTWAGIVRAVLRLRPRHDIRIPKILVSSPASAGFKRALGSPRGQQADWRLTLLDCRDVHAVEFEDHYLVHFDEVAPSCSVVEHMRRDAPGWYRVATTGVGAGIGAAIGGRKGAAVGALLGLVFGMATS